MLFFLGLLTSLALLILHSQNGKWNFDHCAKAHILDFFFFWGGGTIFD
jgi:hypothetical protein